MQGFEILALPGLTLLLLQHVCKAGNGKSGLLNELVGNIDRGTVRSILRITPGEAALGDR